MPAVARQKQKIPSQTAGGPLGWNSATLSTQELGAKRPHAEHVGHRRNVPPLGKHRHRDHTAHRLAQTIDLTDRIHHLAQQLLVGNILAVGEIAGALNLIAAEALDLIGGHRAEVGIERIARLQLHAIDQQRVRAGQAIAVLIKIPKQGLLSTSMRFTYHLNNRGPGI